MLGREERDGGCNKLRFIVVIGASAFITLSRDCCSAKNKCGEHRYAHLITMFSARGRRRDMRHARSRCLGRIPTTGPQRGCKTWVVSLMLPSEIRTAACSRCWTLDNVYVSLVAADKLQLPAQR